MDTCYIVGAGELTSLDIQPDVTDWVIAADGGLAYLLAHGIRADLIMGDFDSLSGGVPDMPSVERFPAEKDDTDMLLAVKRGLSMGYRRFDLYGGLGGRLSHTLGNIQTLAYIAARGAKGRLIGDNAEIYVISNDSIAFSEDSEGYLSVLAFGGDAVGVTIEGTKYTADNVRLTTTFPVGVSNQFIGRPARISVERGILIVIWEKRNPYVEQN